MTSTMRPVPEGTEEYTAFLCDGTIEEAYRDLRNAVLDLTIPFFDAMKIRLQEVKKALDGIKSSDDPRETQPKPGAMDSCEVYWRPVDDTDADWRPFGIITDTSPLIINEEENQP